LPHEESTIKETAEGIRENLRGMSDQQIRGTIAAINATPDVRMLSNPNMDLKGANVVASSWEGLPTGKEASLTLGLGAPQYTRVVSREHTKYFASSFYGRRKPVSGRSMSSFQEMICATYL
jgi:hypothetical protein